MTALPGATPAASQPVYWASCLMSCWLRIESSFSRSVQDLVPVFQVFTVTGRSRPQAVVRARELIAVKLSLADLA
jgi:hypothetical protein